MPRILTVDDSATIRTIISKQMADLGFEVEQAEDGQQALARLRDISVDLILLDVTMPVMDGPSMLAKLRESGNATPVIMLTSESKRSIVANAIRLGIDDYILKPFKPEEIRAKVLKTLRTTPAAGAPAAASVAAAQRNEEVAPPVAVAPAAEPGTADILVVDDMENVHKKLRSLLPPAVTMTGCTNARDALAHAKDTTYRAVVIDLVIPDVNSLALMNQIRALQPRAAMIALALRTTNDIAPELRTQGWKDLLFKPFDQGALDELLSKHLELDDVLAVEENVLRCAPFTGNADRLERYFARLRKCAREAFEQLASACFDDAIVHIADLPMRADRVLRFVVELARDSKALGVTLRLVGTPEIKKQFSQITDVATLPFYTSVDDAREAA